MKLKFTSLWWFLPIIQVHAANFTLINNHAGQSFFNGWDFTDFYDNTTNGDTQYLSPLTNSSANQLAFVNPAGNAIIKIDNTTNVLYPNKRNSIRIQTKDFYEVGSVWIFDAVHLPYGCSVWPAFWSKGFDWPRQGEIDIMEGVNLMTSNQMALHSYAGCTASGAGIQTGTTGETNCNATSSSGCTVTEKAQNSFGPGFATAGGGVWAAQFDVSGIYIWFWGRANIPASITTATDSIDISSWGPPSAAYPATTCNIPSLFGPQQLVIDITLCGDWAGLPQVYTPTCGGDGSANGCYVNSVIGPGSPHFDNAYFEIRYVKTFGTSTAVTVTGTNAATGGPPQPTSPSTSPSTTSKPQGGGGSGNGSGSSAIPSVGGMGLGVVWSVILCAGVTVVLGRFYL